MACFRRPGCGAAVEVEEVVEEDVEDEEEEEEEEVEEVVEEGPGRGWAWA